MNDPPMRPPTPITEADYVVESTYGDRRYRQATLEATLRDVVTRNRRAGGSVLIPAFAVGRRR